VPFSGCTSRLALDSVDPLSADGGQAELRPLLHFAQLTDGLDSLAILVSMALQIPRRASQGRGECALPLKAKPDE
jgi:hypothetical protein